MRRLIPIAASYLCLFVLLGAWRITSQNRQAPQPAPALSAPKKQPEAPQRAILATPAPDLGRRLPVSGLSFTF